MTTLNTRQLIQLADEIKLVTPHCSRHYDNKQRQDTGASWKLVDDHYGHVTVLDQEVELDQVHYCKVRIITNTRPEGFEVLMQFLHLSPLSKAFFDHSH